MITMYINNEEVISDKVINITEEYLNTSSIILNNVYPKSWELDKDYITRFYYPKDYSGFRLYKDDVLIFSGIIKNTADIELNPRKPKYATVQVIDYKTLLSEGNILDFVLVNKTVTECIDKIIKLISIYGFVLGNINIINNEIVKPYNCQNKTAYDVFQYLAEVSQSRWTTRTIDEDTVAIDFYDISLIPQAENIEYTQDYFTKNKVIDMNFKFSTNEYRNVQYIVSDMIYGNIPLTETYTSNGYETIFTTNYKIGEILNITVNDYEQAVSTYDEKSKGIYADFYYTPGEHRFNTNTDRGIYPALTKIQITYIPYIRGREFYTNQEEIKRINLQTLRKGEIVRYENRNDITNSDELLNIAKTYIKYKGKPQVDLTIKTEDIDLFNIGESTYFDINFDELKTNYLVVKKETELNQVKNSTKIFYTYTLNNNYNPETEVNFFDNQRRKNIGNMQVGQTIAKNVDLSKNYLVEFYGSTITEIEDAQSNILNSILNSTFNN